MQVVQEFMNLPVINVPMANQGAEAVPDQAVPVDVPPPAMDAVVYVYADSITSGGECGNITCFDIVFQVNTTQEDGTVKACKVVKRIGVDRARIFDECKDKMTVLEHRQSTDAKRARRLAGLE